MTPSSVCRTFYVSAAGNDSQDGQTELTPWASIDKVNGTHFHPGDQILFHGGDTFSGSLYLGPDTSGTPGALIVVGSYGNGHATISSGSRDGIFVYNTAGIRIEGLTFVGDGALATEGSGLIFYTDLPGDVKLDLIQIEDVEISGFKYGLQVGAWNGNSGFKNVTIRNVVAHDNGSAGIVVWGYYTDWVANYSHQNVVVENSIAYDNFGLPNFTQKHSGNGIVVSGVDGGRIEGCVAHGNGKFNAHWGGGPVGIWVWAVNGVIIQNNESYNNHTGTSSDGGGFDLDGGVTNSILQNNYSHDNDGPGYLLAQFGGAPPWANNIIRNNTSVNDAQRNGYGSIEIWSSDDYKIANVEIYGNTISRNLNAPLVRIVSPTSQVSIHDNRFTGIANMVDVASDQNNSLSKYTYISKSAPIVTWEGISHVGVEAWRTSTGQEPLLSQPPPELILNSGFEDGFTYWSDWGNSSWTNSSPASGTGNGQIWGAGGGGQSISGIQGGLTYQLSIWAKTSNPDEGAWFGITFVNDQDQDIAKFYLPVTTSSYQQYFMPFVAPNSFASAYVWFWKNRNDLMSFDDFSLKILLREN